ncbi:MAG: ADP-ribosylglycohydrolase family protein [Mycolicibacter algericus]|uniref:ADP-ribosylglycohydrolase family protein n=1 Tax=Mycolicibacter algericus TaxID=1288388 RepID=UPI003C76BD78
MIQDKWPNVLRGCAYGDAWGAGNEFRSYAYLTEQSPYGPPLPDKLIITDDTQMTLSLARALDQGHHQNSVSIRARVLDEWVRWYDDPDNNRAPGRTCLTAIAQLRSQTTPRLGYDPSVLRSDGCGTVMRVSPAAFLPSGWSAVAGWQAISTHGGPAGVAAAIIGAGVIRAGALGWTVAGDTIDWAIRRCANHGDAEKAARWLIGYHPRIKDFDDAESYLREGYRDVRAALADARRGLTLMSKAPWGDDPCEYGGQGWRAHHCLATALLCVDLLPADPVSALQRATVTHGDSDSIAAVAGAVLGAVHDDPWPAQWFDRLEPRYQKWIGEADSYRFMAI